jgi:hypothetical protein
MTDTPSFAGLPAPGATVRVEMSKWGDRPHWHFTGTLLGSDEHGAWLGFPAGTHNARPGFAFDSEVDCVTLLAPDGWFAATFHAPGIWCDLYVDVATPAVWDSDDDGAVVRAVDLDLDVIRMAPAPPPRSPLAPTNQRAAWGEAFVDDEDEFAEHQVAFGYPDDVIRNARESCREVLDAVRAGRAPYEGAHERWLAALR